MLKQFTFRQISPLVQSRLDYWFISKGLEIIILTCDITTSVAPDHSGIFLKLKPIRGNESYGKSYWKFNSSLCLDKEFVQGMCEEIKKKKHRNKVVKVHNYNYIDFKNELYFMTL